MAFEGTRNLMLSRFVMDYLGLQPGIVSGVMLVRVHMSARPESIFHALHTIKNVVTGSITYMVNSTRRAELVVKLSHPWDADWMDCSRGIFRFDDNLIKCFLIATVGLLPEEEDDIFRSNIQDFHASAEGIHVLNYPRGYNTAMEEMDLHLNPTMSASTMDTLGVEEGSVECLLKVNIQYIGGPRDFLYALRVANFPYIRFAVDQDGSMYIRFQRKDESDMVAMHHFFVGGRLMVKFYKVASVKKRHVLFDASGQTIWWRAKDRDNWSAILE